MDVAKLPPESPRVASPAAPIARDRRVVIAAVTLILVAIIGWRAPEGWWERIWDLMLSLAWGIAVIRLLAMRATLPARALAGCLVFGVLTAVSVAPVAARLANPYGANGDYYLWFGAMARLAALVVPLAVMVVSGRVYRVLTVADGFLLGFVSGLGFDLLPLLIGADRGNVPYTIDYFPPLQYMAGPRVVPGAAYWTSLVMLVLVAMLRYREAIIPRGAPAVAGRALVAVSVGLAFLWSATEAAALTSQDPEWFVRRFGREGSLTAFLTLAALVVLSWVEVRRGRAHSSDRWRTDLSGVAAVAARFDVRDTMRAMARMRLRTQIGLAEDDLASATDAGVRAYARGAVARLRQLDAGSGGTSPGAGPMRWWRDPAVVHAAGWLVLLTMVFLVPKVARLGTFWKLPVLHFGIGATAFTLFTAGLAILIVSRLVRSMPQARTPADAAETIEFRLEKTVLGVTFAIVALVALYPLPGGGLPVFSMAPGLADRLPDPPAALLMLVAVAASGFAAARTGRWLAQPVPARRPGVVRQSLVAAVGLFLGWLALTLYPAIVVWMHARFGPSVKPWFLEWYGAGQDSAAGFGTSNTLAVASALVVALIGVAAARGLHAWSRRVELFLVDAESRPGASR